MALKVTGLEGKEVADGYYSRTSVPQGRWSDTWDIFKSNFGKIVVLNLLVLLTCVPAFLVVYFRSALILNQGVLYPFNTSVIYPYYPDVTGLAEQVILSTDIWAYALLALSVFIACIGISGAVFTLRKLVQVHTISTYKELMKTFFHGIKVNYLATIFPAMIFMLFFYGTVLAGDSRAHAAAVDIGKAGWTTGYVFLIIATVLVGLYCAWLVAVGSTYRIKLGLLLKNSLFMMIGSPIQTLFMAGFALIPVWLLMIGGFFRVVGLILSVLFGFSFIILCWTSFSQWLFDACVPPKIKSEKELAKEKKSAGTLADGEEEEKQVAMQMLAVGKSELIARPIMPVSSGTAVRRIGKTFSRADLDGVETDRQKLTADISAYEEKHRNDPVFVEYNKLFAEREKALSDDKAKGKKKGKTKKISADNLLR